MENNLKGVNDILLRAKDSLQTKLLQNEDFREWLRIQKLIEYNTKLEKEFSINVSEIKHLSEEAKDNLKDNVENAVEKAELNDSFPRSGTRLRGLQVEYLVAELNTAVSKDEIEERLEDYINERKNIREPLKRSIKQGNLVMVKFNNSNRHSFVALPEWIETNAQGKSMLKKEYSPAINKLPNNFQYDNQTIVGKKN